MNKKFIELSDVLATMDSNYLQHHGIEGMQWGVRRGPPYPLSGNGKSSGTKKKKPTKRVKKMTDEELRRNLERVRTENQYRSEKARANKGRRALNQATQDLRSLVALGGAITGLSVLGKKFLQNNPWILKSVVDAAGIIVKRR